MGKLRLAVIAELTAAFMTVSTVAAQWPTTCVELNDQSEAALGNTQNVGIYQKVFGDAAEQACRNDHKGDVQGVFAWAIGGPPQITDGNFLAMKVRGNLVYSEKFIRGEDGGAPLYSVVLRCPTAVSYTHLTLPTKA